MTRVGAILAALALLYFVCLYTYATVAIAQAKSQGVYPTAEEAALGTWGQELGGARVQSVDINYCGPDYPAGSLSFVWVCNATVKYDRLPSGHNRSLFLAGGYFIHVQDGWVFMPESLFMDFIFDAMELYHMEGYS